MGPSRSTRTTSSMTRTGSARLSEAAEAFEDYDLGESDSGTDDAIFSPSTSFGGSHPGDERRCKVSSISEAVPGPGNHPDGTVREVREVDLFAPGSRHSMDVATALSGEALVDEVSASSESKCLCHPVAEFEAKVMPTDFELGAASYYAGVKNQKRRAKCVPGGITGLAETCAVEDRATGLRVVLFTGDLVELPACNCLPSTGRKTHIAVAVLAFRGTRATHRGNLAADLGILRHNTRQAELRIVEEARQVVLALVGRLEASHPHVRYLWVTAGHSLGGFLATTVAIRFPFIHKCVSFEAPGCPVQYRLMAAERAGGGLWDSSVPVHYWRSRITNYLTLPNPINMSHPHVGRIVRVELHGLVGVNGGGHVIKCIASTLFRWTNWICLTLVIGLMLEMFVGGLRLSEALSRMCALFDSIQHWLLIPFVSSHMSPTLCLAAGLGEGVALMHLAGAAAISFKGTAALMATRLGANLPFQLAAHKLSNILHAFSPETGQPHGAVEMANWPHFTCIKRSAARDLGLFLYDSFVPSATAEGIRHLFDRHSLVNNRVAKLPGYVEARALVHPADAIH